MRETATAEEGPHIAVRLLALAFVLMAPSVARAEWQFKPFFAATFGGDTTLVDLEHAVGGTNFEFGLSGTLLGEFVGIEGDVGYAPGFFQSGDRHLVASSSATTVTGNLVVAAPRHATRYTLRPYFVGGGGMMRARSEDFGGALTYTSSLGALDFGGGVTGFLTKHLGVSWDVRYFRSVHGRQAERGFSIGPEQLSFWRANMALAIRLEAKP